MKKTILFHSNQLGLRGTEIALYDYAHYNETLLGNKSYIVTKRGMNKDVAAEKFINRFGEVLYYDTVFELGKIVEQTSATHAYLIKAGFNDYVLFPGVKNIVHSVFQFNEPHGDVYAYLSEWQRSAVHASNDHPILPHIVTKPHNTTMDYRQFFGIPYDAIVFGRYGGESEFNIPFVEKCIRRILHERNDIWFVFMNTNQFMSHPRVKFVPGTFDLGKKQAFINTCDYMLHARLKGETFGLAIAEFLASGKPVVAWIGGEDKFHHTMIGSNGGFWYDNENDLMLLLSNITKAHGKTPSVAVEEFTPFKIMTTFNSLL
jgi:hypothetical protein